MTFSSALVCALAYALLNFVDLYLLSWQCLTRPIVVAPLVGLLLGDLHTGIIMGASLEAIFMGISAVGGSVPSDALSGSILAVAYTITMGSTVGTEVAMETGFALSMTLGTIMASISGVMMAVWGAMAAYWEKLASECKPGKFFTISTIMSFVAQLPGAIIIFLGCRFGVESLGTALAAAPAWVLTGLSTSGSMMTAVGFGILLSMIWSPDICVFYFVGFVLAKSLGLSSLGIAVLGTAVALTVFFLEKNIVAAKKTGGAATTAAKNSEEDFF